MSFASYLAENKARIANEQQNPPAVVSKPVHVISAHGVSTIKGK